MDAHSKKLAIPIWDWSDRFNPCLHREIKCMDIEAMVATYERHVDLDSITIIEASTNSANLKRMLNEAGYRAEVVRSDTIANKERKRRICDIVDAENLALAYIKGDIDEFVWTPSDRYMEYREDAEVDAAPRRQLQGRVRAGGRRRGSVRSACTRSDMVRETSSRRPRPG